MIEAMSHVTGSVRVVDFDPRWRDDFARLNLEWLELWFTDRTGGS